MHSFTLFVVSIAITTIYLVASPRIACADDPPSNATSTAAQTRAQAGPEIEKQKNEAQQQAEKSIDRDAVAAIEETRNAIRAISEGKTDQANAAIEQAIGKINVVVARNPANALIPVEVRVTLIDAAPLDVPTIRKIASASERAVHDRDYPAARTLLEGLTSELRVRTFHLPLASYPVALREAARLLSEKRASEASGALQTALNTFVLVDRVTPLPILVAQAAIQDAEGRRDNDKGGARALLAAARAELDRARELGYAGNDPEYASLNKSISDLEKQLEGKENTTSAFTKLKEKISSFFHRHSSNERKSDVASR
jgi:hypothetical protein